MSDILDSITAIHSHEERYEKLELFYKDENEKQKILDTVDQLSWRPECQIEICSVEEGDGRGFVSIEFHDDYDKEAGAFFDTLIHRLGIDRCE
ncbi:hypothetical protein [Hydrogenimonas cancrithermarum]|uniref:Uncharacterized protein n=1 Tax=Hydrogenimonas cancrithermarum TaxID=2993563 RepID=A0ABM8FIN4_9BACT|nr:hypothetical protein [Hydrogenimonas cancrithermarum]BDY12147.1 hypothetical protein HCR_04590 [Hydrogenimonas cancrithermarum]